MLGVTVTLGLSVMRSPGPVRVAIYCRFTPRICYFLCGTAIILLGFRTLWLDGQWFVLIEIANTLSQILGRRGAGSSPGRLVRRGQSAWRFIAVSLKQSSNSLATCVVYYI